MFPSMFSLIMAISLVWGVCANPHVLQGRHNEIAKRHSTSVQLHKRFSNARWTFYDVGLGACGKYNVPSDFIVALNSPQFGGGFPGPNCFKMITMTYNGITAQAQIMDECPGCPVGGLDLSTGLFSHFSVLGTGVLYGTWTFNDGSGGGGSPPPSSSSPPPPPKTTSTPWQQPWTPSPTSTWKQPSSTPPASPKTTSTTTTTSSSEKPSTTPHTSSSNSPSPSVNPTSNGLAVPTGILTPNGPQNLNNINSLLLQYGGLILAAASAH